MNYFEKYVKYKTKYWRLVSLIRQDSMQKRRCIYYFNRFYNYMRLFFMKKLKIILLF